MVLSSRFHVETIRQMKITLFRPEQAVAQPIFLKPDHESDFMAYAIRNYTWEKDDVELSSKEKGEMTPRESEQSVNLDVECLSILSFEKIRGLRFQSIKDVEEFCSCHSKMNWRKNILHLRRNQLYLPTLLTNLKELEAHASKIFTRNIFSKVQREIAGDATLLIHDVAKTDDMKLYTITQYLHEGRLWNVEFHMSKSVIQCSCKKFGTDEIPCSHSISVMKAENFQEFPRCCINKRETQNS
ncbi:hypothetical protein M9H77_36333 [Catharanthus roseus]|uniref:Uncharacterized protein n=1 Tax=Catharanthus roseus TaxID=4058 RepID=A0ACB9ZRW2_CATRO|nr:hypothetical protein M9H77_36333 [Catharanthus roseus]